MGADTKAALLSVARLAERQFGARIHKELPTLFVMTSHAAQGDARELMPHLPRGSILCLRDYDLPDRADYAAGLSALARRQGIRFMVAGDVPLAITVRAWGVHIPEGIFWEQRHRLEQARKRLLRISTSVHSPWAAAALSASSRPAADMALVSPVFRTLSHPDAIPLGPVGLAGILSHLRIPAYALGGITEDTLPRLSDLPLQGVAGIRFS